MLAVQLGRHPSLKPVDRDTVWARHPGVYDQKTRRKVVPAAHEDPPSVFINPAKNKYGDRLLPDGRTIEFHPSTNDGVNALLDRLTGREATLYAFLGNNTYRTGRVLVHSVSNGVYHLGLVTPPLPRAPPPLPSPLPPPVEQPPPQPRRVLWADMD